MATDFSCATTGINWQHMRSRNEHASVTLTSSRCSARIARPTKAWSTTMIARQPATCAPTTTALKLASDDHFRKGATSVPISPRLMKPYR